MLACRVCVPVCETHHRSRDPGRGRASAHETQQASGHLHLPGRLRLPRSAWLRFSHRTDERETHALDSPPSVDPACRRYCKPMGAFIATAPHACAQGVSVCLCGGERRHHSRDVGWGRSDALETLQAFGHLSLPRIAWLRSPHRTSQREPHALERPPSTCAICTPYACVRARLMWDLGMMWGVSWG